MQEQLRSGTYMVAGDQWPIFVYKDSKYDPENPWDGLFRSVLLVSVGSITYVYCWDIHQFIANRHTNTFSPPRAQLTMNQRPRAQEMLAYMV